MYRTRLLPGIVGLAMLFVLPAACFGKDYCLTASGGGALVGRGFKVPGKGSCNAWIGFANTMDANPPSSGTGCTSSDGTTLNLTITSSEPLNGGEVFIDSVTLALPAQTGSDIETDVSSGGTNSLTLTGGVCKGIPISAVISDAPAGGTFGVFR
jgi:hypothetical protein